MAVCLYYDSIVECHAQKYTIFSTIAGCVLVIFIFCPTILLILYPTRLFRKCLSYCGFCRLHVLHIYAQSFQGQYKDGTNGTHDFRMVSASFLILRTLILFLFVNHHRLPTHAHIRIASCTFCMYLLYSCYYKTIQVKLHE